jgi:drug/metabolite transporter (DMT)-like permease
MTTRREKVAAWGAWAAVCFFWGTTYLAIRIGLETLPPMLLAGLRFLTAGSILFAFMYFWRGARVPKGRDLFDQALVGLLLLGIGNGLVVWAEQWVPSGLAALMVATSPFWVAGFERLRRDGERNSLRSMAGLLVGFAGLALLVAPGILNASYGVQFLLGLLGIQVGCASWTGGSVYSKHHHSEVKPLMAAAMQMLFAGLALLLAGSIAGEWRVLRFSVRSFSAFAYLVLFGSIVAYGSYTYAMQKLPLSIVSMYSYINPVIAVLLGWLILSEPLGWRMILAMGVILCGVALVKSARRETAAAKEQSSTEAEKRQEILHASRKAYSAGAN